MRETLLLCFVALAVFVHSAFVEAKERVRPNFVIIVTDDQNREELSKTLMPKTYERIVQQGASFSHAFVTTSLCCPSRASIFTGLLARHHGVQHNSGRLRRTNFNHVPRFPEELKKAGY